VEHKNSTVRSPQSFQLSLPCCSPHKAVMYLRRSRTSGVNGHRCGTERQPNIGPNCMRSNCSRNIFQEDSPRQEPPRIPPKCHHHAITPFSRPMTHGSSRYNLSIRQLLPQERVAERDSVRKCTSWKPELRYSPDTLLSQSRCTQYLCSCAATQ
jgi:hypothetical protein